MHVVRDLGQLAVDGHRLEHLGHQCPGADHIGREGLVDRRVEGHVTGAVHQHVQVVRQVRDVGQVTLDHVDPLLDQGLRAAGGLPQILEDALLQQLDRPGPAVAEPLRRTRTPARVSGREVSNFHNSCSPMKPVTPGDDDLLAGQQVGHPTVQRAAAPDPGDDGSGLAHAVASVSSPAAMRRASDSANRPSYRAVPMMAPSTPDRDEPGQLPDVGQGGDSAGGDHGLVGPRADGPPEQLEVGAAEHPVGLHVGHHEPGATGLVQPLQGLEHVPPALPGPAAGGQSIALHVQPDRDPVAVAGDDLGAPLRVLQGGGADIDPGAAGGQGPLQGASSRIPPDSSTCNFICEVTSAITSALEPRPNAASRSTR